jgi:hypothetical protein
LQIGSLYPAFQLLFEWEGQETEKKHMGPNGLVALKTGAMSRVDLNGPAYLVAKFLTFPWVG